MIWECRDIVCKKFTQEKLAKFIKIFELYQVFIHNFLFQNVRTPRNHILSTRIKTIFSPSPNFYHFSTLPVKIGFIYFFLVFRQPPIPPSCRMPYCRHQFFAYIFLHALRFSNLLRQAKNLI